MGGHVGRLQPDGRSRVRQSRKHMPSIGVTLMMVFDFVGLIAVAVIGGGGGDPEKSPFFRLTTAIAS